MSQTLRVLVVEGDRDRADSLAFHLQAAGFEAAIVLDGVSGFDVMRTFRPDVCLVDVNVMDLGGNDLARHVQAEFESPPLFANVTPFSERDEWEVDLEFDLEFTKPSDPVAIVGQLSNFLRTDLRNMSTKSTTPGRAPRLPHRANVQYAYR